MASVWVGTYFYGFGAPTKETKWFLHGISYVHTCDFENNMEKISHSVYVRFSRRGLHNPTIGLTIKFCYDKMMFNYAMPKDLYMYISKIVALIF